MRRVLAALIAVLALLAACALCEETGAQTSQELAAAYKAKYEESVAFKAIRSLSRYASDDLTLNQSVMSIHENSTAWEYMKYLEDGFFSAVKTREYTDYSSDNWVVLSDTEFCCDVYCTLTINFSTNNAVVVFPCAYHFCFRQYNKEKDFWQAYDFCTLASDADEDVCERVNAEYEGLSLYTVTGKTYRGFMLVVDDPSRVFVGTIDRLGGSAQGLRVDELYAKYSDIAIACINGGGFADSGGKSTGGDPYGTVISQGNMLRTPEYKSSIAGVTMGFDADNKLRVGNFTYNQVLEMGLRDALAFHPALVVDGEKVSYTEKRQYTIRTAIGQDADGHVLMLVIKGRQPDSLGASMDDLVEIMLQYGAVNAGNLDGGSSTCMYMDGESIYSGYWPAVSRRLPCAFFVKKTGE